VNLDAIAGNVQSLCRLAAGAQLMAVVKANGYGHGALAVGKAALEAGATWLGVYTVEEGGVLRQGGIEAPILVFGPFEPGEAADIWRWNLTPTVTSLAAAEALQRMAAGRRLRFHLKLDTGLARAGVCPSEAIPLVNALRRFPALEPQGVYTHFASADEAFKEPTRDQLRIFLATASGLAEAGFNFPLKHAANSAATLDMPETHLDMVRTGIGMYGCYPSSDVRRTADLQPALRLLSAVSRVHGVPAGTGVGYGHEFRCCRDSTIALVPIGYGDGLPRSLGHGSGRVIIRGTCAPIVGRVSMDQITVDVTDVPEVYVGDPVTLIGQDRDAVQTADDVAAQAGTISYDIVTGLLPRVPRLYRRDSSRGMVGVMQLTSG
jgi:alanine racemase